MTTHFVISSHGEPIASYVSPGLAARWFMSRLAYSTKPLAQLIEELEVGRCLEGVKHHGQKIAVHPVIFDDR